MVGFQQNLEPTVPKHFYTPSIQKHSMNDTILLEETIRMTLHPYPNGLQDYKIENKVVNKLGRSGNPVDMKAYEAAIGNLLQTGILERTKVEGEGYALGQRVEELGYKLR